MSQCTKEFHDKLFIDGIKQCPNCQKPIHNEVTATVTSQKINLLVGDLMTAISEMVGENVPEGIPTSAKMYMFQVNFLSAVMQVTSNMLQKAPISIAWGLERQKKDANKK